MTKKSGLGENPLAWVKDTRKDSKGAEREVPPQPETEVEIEAEDEQVQIKVKSKVKKSKTSELPKFETFEVRLSILLRTDQLEFLDRLTREIMKNRTKDNRKERITKNTVLRACLDAFQEVEIETKDIPDEGELVRRIKRGIR